MRSHEPTEVRLALKDAAAEASCGRLRLRHQAEHSAHAARESCRVTVVPAETSAEDVLAMKPDGVFLSNGPGDPEPVTYAQSRTSASMMGKVPMFGICLGHQLIGLALGGKTYKLKFGHHGGNHPVRTIATGKVEITAHNHNFAVDPDSLQRERSGADAHRI